MVAEKLKSYFALVFIRLKSQTVYRTSYLIEMLGHVLFMFTHLGGILFVFYHVKEIKGWTLWEVVYLYGLTTTSFTITQLIAEGFEDLSLYIKSGEFDRFLLRPVSPLIQVASLSFKIDRLGGVLQGVVILIMAIYKNHIYETPFHWYLIGSSLISMITVFYSLFLLNGALSFWTLENSEAFNAFTYGGVELGKYPLSIYKDWMQNLFLYLVPLGFVSYLPGVLLFNKSPQTGFWIHPGFFAPVVAIGFCGLVFYIWSLSLKHYQSTGS